MLASIQVRDFVATDQDAVITLGCVAVWGPKRVHLEALATFSCAGTCLEMLERAQA